MRGGRRGTLASAVVAGGAILGAANLAGWWWITPLAGPLSGLVLRGWLGAAVAGLVGALGWALPLAWQAVRLPIGEAAAVLAGITGLGTGHGVLMIAATTLLGLLLCTSAAWLGGALRRLLAPPTTGTPGT